MGEVADMMLEGTLCAGCGVYIGRGDFGIPQYCEDCKGDYPTEKPKREKIKCPKCGKRCSGKQGLSDHDRDAHKVEKILVQTYYTTEGDEVYLHRKIGEDPWEKILTPYKEVPYIINTWYSKEELDTLAHT